MHPFCSCIQQPAKSHREDSPVLSAKPEVILEPVSTDDASEKRFIKALRA